MRLRQLECFRALMLHGTMTRAAELLGMSQPGISAMIANLEHATGLTLFVRRGGRLQPTPEARLFYVEAARALEAVENTARIASEIRSGRRGHLAIAAYPSVSISLLPRLLADFAAKRPDLQIKIITRASASVRELMSTQQFDIAVAELPLDYPTAHMEVFAYECLCMLPKGHRLAKLKQVTPADLDGEPFVTLFRGDPIYQQLASAFSEYGARWNVVAETEFFSTACELVAAGRGVGLVDPVVSRPFTANVVLRPFKPAINYQVALLFPVNEALSQVAQEFVDVLRRRLRP
ncbi:LysR family transcriptional regulator [Bradyrhizobium sp. U87765 SZCCT0131]|uniref:LysR family transcriptional regulator n=1 Tax=unclassified Bradyrhizobium TaxID=2631580 RepID=UPI001BA691AB|nr:MULTISPECIES: LysR family transcriptional regulator [unclassified Bradyrhizobium]MBR1219092.1 LysR family transcriptional regulator [Bradyrhizobium sp. U87765 SZCCT0131]MBR1261743.1 LysR family transcriptional regulator [Bradyrhizobium sp. U87765 SZCCT0134]MBR1306404.1 LysR family transcriptional regulator [Bradyrhizobium sp. U87765 SZCCT0110]MBR1317525.1 LysR family transcriptional regulator [Bradyrhizobium sp. U87765 SZCCT0109]MBR1351227.1 LysR family transcriptional regulator [Bradyrhizo